jgi:hypothetical protein
MNHFAASGKFAAPAKVMAMTLLTPGEVRRVKRQPMVRLDVNLSAIGGSSET